MGFFDFLKGKKAEEWFEVYSPLNGKVIPLSEVPDEAFAQIAGPRTWLRGITFQFNGELYSFFTFYLLRKSKNPFISPFSCFNNFVLIPYYSHL